METWIVYDLASGEARYRAGGAPGTSAIAAGNLAEGLALVIVPAEAVNGPDIDLAVVRAQREALIDIGAERARQLMITPFAGQRAAYAAKEAEARAWLTDPQAAAPYLRDEAAATGTDLGQLAARVIANAEASEGTERAIETLRRASKVALAAADTLGAIVAASAVDWTVIGAAA